MTLVALDTADQKYIVAAALFSGPANSYSCISARRRMGRVPGCGRDLKSIRIICAHAH